MAQMQDALAMIYLWLKAGHILFVIFWMAGLFMLPRFFVYHHEDGAPGSDSDKVWIHREQRLLKIILMPSMIAVWVLGLTLAWTTGAFAQGWFHFKLLLVLALSGYHGWMASYAKKLVRGERSLEGRQLRILNEVPGLVAVLVVILAVVRPF